MSTYGYSKKVPGTFSDAVTKTTEALANEGFGVLTTIDLKLKLKEKLAVEVQDYIILGACSPPHAYQALQAEPEIGLLLPCNVIVYQTGIEVTVAAQLPTIALGIAQNEKLAALAEEVEKILKRVIDAV